MTVTDRAVYCCRRGSDPETEQKTRIAIVNISGLRDLRIRFASSEVSQASRSVRKARILPCTWSPGHITATRARAGLCSCCWSVSDSFVCRADALRAISSRYFDRTGETLYANIQLGCEQLIALI